MDCKECHERFRADKVIEDWCQENGFQLGRSVDAMSQQEMKSFIDEHQIACPTCGKFKNSRVRKMKLPGVISLRKDLPIWPMPKGSLRLHQIACPTCGKFNWTDIRQFNLMFKTFQGVTEDAKYRGRQFFP